MSAGATLDVFVLTNVRTLLDPITAPVPWASNFLLTAGHVKVRRQIYMG